MLGLIKLSNEQPTKQTRAKEVKPEKGRIEMHYKKIISLLSVLAIVTAAFMMSGPVAAGGDASTESVQAAPAEKTVEGTLVAMERYGHLLIRPETGNLTRLKMRPDTVITRNGKPAKLSDLHANDKIRANYDSKNWVSELNATGS